MIRVQKVRLYPNQTMKKVLDDLCDYRRYCWNQGLALWNDMYDSSLILENKKLKPSERKVRDELVANKDDWQYQLSARCLQLAISDLGKAWDNFFNKAQVDWGKPKFKSKKAPRQGFKTDRAKIINGKLRLDKPHGIKTWYDIKFKGAKLQRDYHKVANIQHDIMHKFTTKLVSDYDKIVIEDLDVKKMQMTHVASKGLQRSLFGYFRQVLVYKADWYGKKIVLANRYYPSTQRCSECGHVKTGEDKIGLDGNRKHGTKHNEYICYECGAIMNRDENAVANLLALLN